MGDEPVGEIGASDMWWRGFGGGGLFSGSTEGAEYLVQFEGATSYKRGRDEFCSSGAQ